MNLYFVDGTIRDFVLSSTDLGEGYTLVSNTISDAAALEPILSKEIYDAIGSIASDGFCISFIN